MRHVCELDPALIQVIAGDALQYENSFILYEFFRQGGNCKVPLGCLRKMYASGDEITMAAAMYACIHRDEATIFYMLASGLRCGEGKELVARAAANACVRNVVMPLRTIVAMAQSNDWSQRKASKLLAEGRSEEIAMEIFSTNRELLYEEYFKIPSPLSFTVKNVGHTKMNVEIPAGACIGKTSKQEVLRVNQAKVTDILGDFHDVPIAIPGGLHGDYDHFYRCGDIINIPDAVFFTHNNKDAAGLFFTRAECPLF